MHTLKAIQQFPVAADKVWEFIANPHNLNKITPPEMGFTTLSDRENHLYPGQIIEYTVKPLFGIPLSWVTEITHVNPGFYFVDEQRFGPYSFWHHKHFVREIPGGTQMEDIIHYKLPMGIFGRLAHPILVKPKLDALFEYRKNQLIDLFGQFHD